MFGKSQEIADLQAALSVAIGERDSLATAALTHEAAINALTADRDAAVAQVANAQAAVAAAETERATATAAASNLSRLHAAIFAAAEEPAEGEGDATERAISALAKVKGPSAVAAAVNTGIINGIASAGVGVIPKDPTAAANGDPQKPDLSALHGIEKARAALASKQPVLN